MTTTDNVPPLPEPTAWRWPAYKLRDVEWRYAKHKTQENATPLFSDDLMRAYILADRAARAAPVQPAALVLASMWSEYKADHPSYRTDYQEGYLDALDAAEQRLRAGAPAQPALQQFKECWNESSGNDPLERLRFFCSLAMNGQDWLDVEPFFDALAATAQPAEPVALNAVTLESAKAAMRHIEQHNGPGRYVQAFTMLEAAPPKPALTEDRIGAIWSSVAEHEADNVSWDTVIAFARAVLAAGGAKP